MPDFIYKARDARGELVTGLLAAATSADASAALRAEGKFIVKLDPASRAASRKQAGEPQAGSDTGQAARTRGRVRRSDVITFAHQLAVMVDTGVPISEALACVAEQAESPAFKAVVQDVASHVEAGGELSRGLLRHPRVFPPIMTSLVRASEVSGTMGPMLDRVSAYLAKEQQTVKKIKGALTYPAAMLVMLIVVTAGLLVWVLPRFASIFESKGAALPMPTVILMAVSDSLIGYWYCWAAGLVALVVGFVLSQRTVPGRNAMDHAKLASPVLGKLFGQLYVTRATRTMGTMIAAGVPVLDMVAIVREVTGNVRYDRLWAEVDERLRQGSQLSEVLLRSPLIPRPVAQMIYAGEKSGRLGPTMEKIATYTEQEFDEQVKTTTNLIEPLMVSLMGGVIGFVAIALLLPIFSVSSVVGK